MKPRKQIFIFSIAKTFTAIFFLTFSPVAPTLQVLAQIRDDFSDNELLTNPTWTGSTDHFIVREGTLRLSAPAVSGSSFLSTLFTQPDHCSWEGVVTLGFNPSGSNLARVYLMSDNPNLSGDLNGYYIQLGGTADEIALYRQSGSVRTKIIDGTDKTLDSESVTVRIYAERTPDGVWTLFSDVGNTGTRTLEGSATDRTHIHSSHTGLQCIYTSTRSDKFSFDDFVVSAVQDITPPVILGYSVSSATALTLIFSEKLDPETGENTAHYKLSTGVPILSATLQNDSVTIALTFKEPLRKSQTISVEEVTDLAGNTIEPKVIPITYTAPVTASFKDIVITEIMADYSPEVELPSAEYIEIYNRSDKTFSLSGWSIGDGSLAVSFSQDSIGPGTFRLLTASANIELFKPFTANIIGFPAFPSLNNNGDVVIFRNSSGLTIDSVVYTNEWYRDNEKMQGGWSLEIIDPDNLCSDDRNWSASEDDTGGTPGKINSVDAEKPDLMAPEIVSAFLVSPDTVVLEFNERLAKNVLTTAKFDFKDIGISVLSRTIDEDLRVIRLTCDKPFSPGKQYLLQISDVSDCTGNVFRTPAIIALYLPERADSLDVIVNEILFNPKSGGVDFVEIKNRSGKVIDLKGWSLANMVEGRPDNLKAVSSKTMILAPGHIVAFSSDRSATLSGYPLAPPERIFTAATPPMNDDDGSIAVLDTEGNTIDVLFYSNDLHSIFLEDEEGVSLERISSDVFGNTNDNWKSASTSSGYGTPGYENSNHLEHQISDDVTIHPEVFLPVSGQPNYSTFTFRFDHPGYTGNVKIVDAQGRLVRTIAENELLGTTGFFRWDGERDDGRRAWVGAYMVIFEVFDPSGKTKTILRRVAVAGRF
jgi:hypothetical protein